MLSQDSKATPCYPIESDEIRRGQFGQFVRASSRVSIEAHGHPQKAAIKRLARTIMWPPAGSKEPMLRQAAIGFASSRHTGRDLA
jgi:hypothetical protein